MKRIMVGLYSGRRRYGGSYDLGGGSGERGHITFRYRIRGFSQQLATPADVVVGSHFAGRGRSRSPPLPRDERTQMVLNETAPMGA
jgi:hypothetical protein